MHDDSLKLPQLGRRGVKDPSFPGGQTTNTTCIYLVLHTTYN